MNDQQDKKQNSNEDNYEKMLVANVNQDLTDANNALKRLTSTILSSSSSSLSSATLSSSTSTLNNEIQSPSNLNNNHLKSCSNKSSNRSLDQNNKNESKSILATASTIEFVLNSPMFNQLYNINVSLSRLNKNDIGINNENIENVDNLTESHLEEVENDKNEDEEEESDDSYAAQFSSRIHKLTVVYTQCLFSDYSEFLSFKKSENFVGGGLFRVLFLTNKSLMSSQSTLTDSLNYENLYVFFMEIKQFRNKNENKNGEIKMNCINEKLEIKIDNLSNEKYLQYWIFWRDEKDKLQSKDQLLFINGVYFDSISFKDAHHLLTNLNHSKKNDLILNNNNNQVDFLISRNLNKKTTLKYLNKKKSKSKLFSDSLLSLRSFSSTNSSSSSTNSLISSSHSFLSSNSIFSTTPTIAPTTKAAPVFTSSSFTSPSSNSSSVSSSILLYNLNDDSLLRCSIPNCNKRTKRFKQRFFHKYFNSDYSSNEKFNFDHPKDTNHKESSFKFDFAGKYCKSQMTLRDAMVLNTEWTQIETIELLNELSSGGNNNNNAACGGGGGGSGGGSGGAVIGSGSSGGTGGAGGGGGSGGFGFGITGNKSTGVVVKAVTIGGSAHKIGDINVRSMSSEQVASVLRQSSMQGQYVKFVVARPVHISGNVDMLTQKDLLTSDPSKLNLSNISTNPNSQCLLIPTAEIMDKKTNLQQRIQQELEQRAKQQQLEEEEQQQAKLDIKQTSDQQLIKNNLNEEKVKPEESLLNEIKTDEIKQLQESPVPKTETINQQQEQNALDFLLKPDDSSDKIYFLELTQNLPNNEPLKPTFNLNENNENLIVLNLTSLNSYLKTYSIEISIEQLDLTIDLKSSNFQSVCKNFKQNSNRKFYFFIKEKFDLNEQLEQFDELVEINSVPTENLISLPKCECEKFFDGLLASNTIKLKLLKNFRLKMFKLKEKWLHTLLNDFSYLNDNDLDSNFYSECLAHRKYEVEIIVSQIDKRKTKSLGISLEGTVDIDDNGVETCPHHYIRSIMKDGPVDNAEPTKLHSGDELLEIDFVKLYAINYLELLEILRHLNNKVVILVCARKTKNENAELFTSVVNGNGMMSKRAKSEGHLDTTITLPSELFIESTVATTQTSISEKKLAEPNLLDLKETTKSTPSISDAIRKNDNNLKQQQQLDDPITKQTLTKSSSKISKSTTLLVRSRSLELNGLALWNRKINYIKLTKSAKGLGFSLIDYQQDPFNPLSKTMIVIRALVPNGVAQLDGRLMPGQRLVSINDVQLDEDLITPSSISTSSLNAVKQSNGKLVDLLKYTVDLLKSLPVGKSVNLGVQKPLPYPDAIEPTTTTTTTTTTTATPKKNQTSSKKKESRSSYSINNKSKLAPATEPLPRKSKNKTNKRKIIITSSRYDLKQASEENLHAANLNGEECDLIKSGSEDSSDTNFLNNDTFEDDLKSNDENEIFFNDFNNHNNNDENVEYGFVATSAPAILNQENFNNNSMSDNETVVTNTEHHSFYSSTNQLKLQTFELINKLNSGSNSKFNSTVELLKSVNDQPQPKQQLKLLKSKSMFHSKVNEELDDLNVRKESSASMVMLAPLSMPELETADLIGDENKLPVEIISETKSSKNTLLKSKKSKKNHRHRYSTISHTQKCFKLTVSNVDMPDEGNCEINKADLVENYLKTQEENLNENASLLIGNNDENMAFTSNNSDCLTNSAVFLNFILNFNNKLKELEATNVDEVYASNLNFENKPLEDVIYKSEDANNAEFDYRVVNPNVFSNKCLVNEKQLITEEQFNQAFLLNTNKKLINLIESSRILKVEPDDEEEEDLEECSNLKVEEEAKVVEPLQPPPPQQLQPPPPQQLQPQQNQAENVEVDISLRSSVYSKHVQKKKQRNKKLLTHLDNYGQQKSEIKSTSELLQQPELTRAKQKVNNQSLILSEKIKKKSDLEEEETGSIVTTNEASKLTDENCCFIDETKNEQQQQSVNVRKNLSESLGALNVDKYNSIRLTQRKKQKQNNKKTKLLNLENLNERENLLDIYRKSRKLDEENSCLLEMIKDMANVKWSSVDIGQIDPPAAKTNDLAHNESGISKSATNTMSRLKQIQFNESNLSEINLKENLSKSTKSILTSQSVDTNRSPSIGAAARSFSSDYRLRSSSRVLRNPTVALIGAAGCGAASTSTPASRCSSRSGSVKIINILGKEIVKLPVVLEREIKIKKNFDQFGITSVDCQVDEGINGCAILKIEPNSACAKDKRLKNGDYLLSVNNEQMRNLTNASAKAILKRASLTSSDVVIIYIPLSEAIKYIETLNKLHNYSFSTNKLEQTDIKTTTQLVSKIGSSGSQSCLPTSPSSSSSSASSSSSLTSSSCSSLSSTSSSYSLASSSLTSSTSSLSSTSSSLCSTCSYSSSSSSSSSTSCSSSSNRSSRSSSPTSTTTTSSSSSLSRCSLTLESSSSFNNNATKKPYTSVSSCHLTSKTEPFKANNEATNLLTSKSISTINSLLKSNENNVNQVSSQSGTDLTPVKRKESSTKLDLKAKHKCRSRKDKALQLNEPLKSKSDLDFDQENLGKGKKLSLKHRQHRHSRAGSTSLKPASHNKHSKHNKHKHQKNHHHCHDHHRRTHHKHNPHKHRRRRNRHNSTNQIITSNTNNNNTNSSPSKNIRSKSEEIIKPNANNQIAVISKQKDQKLTTKHHRNKKHSKNHKHKHKHHHHHHHHHHHRHRKHHHHRHHNRHKKISPKHHKHHKNKAKPSQVATSRDLNADLNQTNLIEIVDITKSLNEKLLEQNKLNNNEPTTTTTTTTTTGSNLLTMTSSNDLASSLWGSPRLVILQRLANKSLGISIVGGKLDVCQTKNETTEAFSLAQTNLNSFISGIFIKHVLDQSPAGLNGTLKTGDRILAVNDVDLTNATHDRAVEVIRNAKTPVKFLIQSLICNNYIPTCDETNLPGDTLNNNNNNNNNKTNNENRDELNEDVLIDPEKQIINEPNKYNYSLEALKEKYNYLIETNLKNNEGTNDTANNNNNNNNDNNNDETTTLTSLIKKGKIFIFKLRRNFVNENLGLSLSGNVNLTKTSVFVCGIYKDSIAYKHGLVKVGDQILEINGQSLYGRAHSNVTPLIRNIKDLDVYIVILRHSDNLSQMFKPNQNVLNRSFSNAAVPSNFNSNSNESPVNTQEFPEKKSAATSPTSAFSISSLVREISLKKTNSLTNQQISEINKSAGNSQNNESIDEKQQQQQQKQQPHVKLATRNVQTASPISNKIIRRITLKKGPTGFGIAISEDRYNRLIIRGLNPNGVAFQDGQMEVGDEIIGVNNLKVNTMKYDDVMHLLHSTQDPVEFHVTKPDVITGSSSVQSHSLNGSVNASGSSSPVPLQNKPQQSQQNSQPEQTQTSQQQKQPSPPETPTNTQNNTPPTQPAAIEQNLQRTLSKTQQQPSANVTTQASPANDPKMNKIKVGEETLIEIERGKLGLGLSIVGGSDTQLPGIIIHDIYQSGAAYKDRRLCIGDQILKVNNIDLTNATHELALNALRQTSDSVRLLVHRGFYSTQDVEHSTITSNTSNEASTDKLATFGTSLDDEKYLNVINVELNKKFGKGLGFSIIGRRDGSGVFISHIIEGGCAHKDGRLMIGDLILEVNSQDIRKSPYNEVAFLLKTLPQGKVNLKIGRFKTSANVSNSNSTNTSANASKTTSRRNSLTGLTSTNHPNEQISNETSQSQQSKKISLNTFSRQSSKK